MKYHIYLLTILICVISTSCRLSTSRTLGLSSKCTVNTEQNSTSISDQNLNSAVQTKLEGIKIETKDGVNANIKTMNLNEFVKMPREYFDVYRQKGLKIFFAAKSLLDFEELFPSKEELETNKKNCNETTKEQYEYNKDAWRSVANVHNYSELKKYCENYSTDPKDLVSQKSRYQGFYDTSDDTEVSGLGTQYGPLIGNYDQDQNGAFSLIVHEGTHSLDAALGGFSSKYLLNLFNEDKKTFEASDRTNTAVEKYRYSNTLEYFAMLVDEFTCSYTTQERLKTTAPKGYEYMSDGDKFKQDLVRALNGSTSSSNNK